MSKYLTLTEFALQIFTGNHQPAKFRSEPPKTIIMPPSKGHKKFIIDGEEVWALNFKNAQRKIKALQKPNKTV
jgi:hypothetical protein